MLIALIGMPASGKTSLMREIIKFSDNWQYKKYKKLRFMINKPNKVIILGVYPKEGLFVGTDKLSMAVQPDAIEFIKEYSKKNPSYFFLTEGDRLNNLKFYNEINKHLKIKIFHLKVSDEIYWARQSTRNQSDLFLKRVKTKIENIKDKLIVQDLINDNEKEQQINLEIIKKLFYKEKVKIK